MTTRYIYQDTDKINHRRMRLPSMSAVQGPVGPQGIPGPQGNPGNDGTNGTNGTNGSIGATGPQGPIGLTGASGVSGLVAANYQQTILSYSGSDVTWTYSIPFGSGVVPVIEALAATGTASSTGNYNVMIVGNPTNTSCVFRVNTVPAASLSLAGLLSLTLFQQAPTGVKIHATARNP
jgi:hypothetical protein